MARLNGTWPIAAALHTAAQQVAIVFPVAVTARLYGNCRAAFQLAAFRIEQQVFDLVRRRNEASLSQSCHLQLQCLH